MILDGTSNQSAHLISIQSSPNAQSRSIDGKHMSINIIDTSNVIEKYQTNRVMFDSDPNFYDSIFQQVGFKNVEENKRNSKTTSQQNGCYEELENDEQFIYALNGEDLYQRALEKSEENYTNNPSVSLLSIQEFPMLTDRKQSDDDQEEEEQQVIEYSPQQVQDGPGRNNNSSDHQTSDQSSSSSVSDQLNDQKLSFTFSVPDGFQNYDYQRRMYREILKDQGISTDSILQQIKNDFSRNKPGNQSQAQIYQNNSNSGSLDIFNNDQYNTDRSPLLTQRSSAGESENLVPGGQDREREQEICQKQAPIENLNYFELEKSNSLPNEQYLRMKILDKFNNKLYYYGAEPLVKITQLQSRLEQSTVGYPMSCQSSQNQRFSTDFDKIPNSVRIKRFSCEFYECPKALNSHTPTPLQEEPNYIENDQRYPPRESETKQKVSPYDQSQYLKRNNQEPCSLNNTKSNNVSDSSTIYSEEAVIGASDLFSNYYKSKDLQKTFKSELIIESISDSCSIQNQSTIHTPTQAVLNLALDYNYVIPQNNKQKINPSKSDIDLKYQVLSELNEENQNIEQEIKEESSSSQLEKPIEVEQNINNNKSNGQAEETQIKSDQNLDGSNEQSHSHASLNDTQDLVQIENDQIFGNLLNQLDQAAEMFTHTHTEYRERHQQSYCPKSFEQICNQSVLIDRTPIKIDGFNLRETDSEQLNLQSKNQTESKEDQKFGQPSDRILMTRKRESTSTQKKQQVGSNSNSSNFPFTLVPNSENQNLFVQPPETEHFNSPGARQKLENEDQNRSLKEFFSELKKKNRIFSPEGEIDECTQETEKPFISSIMPPKSNKKQKENVFNNIQLNCQPVEVDQYTKGFDYQVEEFPLNQGGEIATSSSSSNNKMNNYSDSHFINYNQIAQKHTESVYQSNRSNYQSNLSANTTSKGLGYYSFSQSIVLKSNQDEVDNSVSHQDFQSMKAKMEMQIFQKWKDLISIDENPPSITPKIQTSDQHQGSKDAKKIFSQSERDFDVKQSSQNDGFMFFQDLLGIDQNIASYYSPDDSLQRSENQNQLQNLFTHIPVQNSTQQRKDDYRMTTNTLHTEEQSDYDLAKRVNSDFDVYYQDFKKQKVKNCNSIYNNLDDTMYLRSKMETLLTQIDQSNRTSSLGYFQQNSTQQSLSNQRRNYQESAMNQINSSLEQYSSPAQNQIKAQKKAFYVNGFLSPQNVNTSYKKLDIKRNTNVTISNSILSPQSNQKHQSLKTKPINDSQRGSFQTPNEIQIQDNNIFQSFVEQNLGNVVKKGSHLVTNATNSIIDMDFNQNFIKKNKECLQNYQQQVVADPFEEFQKQLKKNLKLNLKGGGAGDKENEIDIMKEKITQTNYNRSKIFKPIQ